MWLLSHTPLSYSLRICTIYNVLENVIYSTVLKRQQGCCRRCTLAAFYRYRYRYRYRCRCIDIDVDIDIDIDIDIHTDTDTDTDTDIDIDIDGWMDGWM